MHWSEKGYILEVGDVEMFLDLLKTQKVNMVSFSWLFTKVPINGHGRYIRGSY
jgi:hypothetical protein